METGAPAFSCPCGDPLMAPLRALLDPALHRARDGLLSHTETIELASGRLAVGLLEQSGEEDKGLRRGKPLYLSKPRVAALRIYLPAPPRSL